MNYFSSLNPSALLLPSAIARALALSGPSASAQDLVSYAFTPGNIFGPTSSNPAIVASSMSDAVGDFDISSTSGTAFLRASSSEATLALALANPDYLQFTLTPAAGQIINLEAILFDHEGSNNNGQPEFTSNVSIFASLTGFAVPPVAGDALGTSTATVPLGIGGSPVLLVDDVSFSLAAPQFQGLTSAQTVTFRIYGFDDANNLDQIGRVDDVRVVGSVVPEPASFVLVLAGAAITARRRRR